MSGAEIRQLRQQLGLTQAQFGQLLGVHSLTVARWEKGDATSPSPHHIALMQSFAAARSRQPDIGAIVLQLLVGAGVAFALYKLLEAAFADGSRRNE